MSGIGDDQIIVKIEDNNLSITKNFKYLSLFLQKNEGVEKESIKFFCSKVFLKIKRKF